MSEQSSDPRDRLVREKYFSLRPKPLERWLWQRGVPQATERVFWLHWEEGMRARDWCSEVPLRRVAALCCVDASTVTRAYQLLKTLGLIRRQDPGRDPRNPFQQATAVTEVRIPRELLLELSRSPNRCRISPTERVGGRHGGAGDITAPESPQALKTAPGAPESAPTSPDPALETPIAARRATREDIQALWGRASVAERGRYFTASRAGSRQIEFEADTQLTLEDRAELLRQLEQMARARSRAPEAPTSVQPGPTPPNCAKNRRLSPLDLARTRKRVLETVPVSQAQEVLRQVVWAVEEGVLRRFELPLAVNIALKKLREGAWSRPNRMPPHWARLAALPETCSAA
ncbi:MAG TPA: hypothetical protein VIY90_09325 [Steroidobacteraceae bacterium]